MLCLPRIASSGCSCSTTFCSRRATPSWSSSPSWFTQTALWAPIASAWRSCSCTSLPPMETTTTSPPCLAARRRPSSTAISSNGLILYLSPSFTIPVPSGFTRIFDSASSTRLAVTRIFTTSPWKLDDEWNLTRRGRHRGLDRRLGGAGQRQSIRPNSFPTLRWQARRVAAGAPERGGSALRHPLPVLQEGLDAALGEGVVGELLDDLEGDGGDVGAETGRLEHV